MRNWLTVYLCNVICCLGTVVLVVWADIASLGGGAVGETAVQIARAKAGLSLGEALARGLLCSASCAWQFGSRWAGAVWLTGF